MRAFWKSVEPGMGQSRTWGDDKGDVRCTSFVFENVVDPRGLDDFLGFGVEFDVVEF